MPSVCVLGAGPAGVMAAIYLKRNGVDVALLERRRVGGLARNANLIEDYPGFPRGISGSEFCARLEGQLVSAGIAPTVCKVNEVRHDGDSFFLGTTVGELQYRALIVATGTRPEELVADGTDRIKARIHYEVAEMADASGGERVAVVGGGEAALDYALTLLARGFAPEVFCRGSGVKANPRLLARFSEAGVPLHLGQAIHSMAMAGGRVSITFATGETHAADYLLAALGRSPEFPVFGAGLPEEIEMGEDGQTNVPGLFLAGDVRRGLDRHVATAVGDGMRAAMAARRFVEGREV